MKITLHIDIEITDTGQVAISRSTWTPHERPNISPALLDGDVAAFAQAFVSNRTGPPLDVPHGDDAIDATPGPLFPELGGGSVGTQQTHRETQQQVRPGRLALPVPTPNMSTDHGPQHAINAMVSIGVTATLAKQFVAARGSARVLQVANWMRDQSPRNPDAMARKILAQP